MATTQHKKSNSVVQKIQLGKPHGLGLQCLKCLNATFKELTKQLYQGR